MRLAPNAAMFIGRESGVRRHVHILPGVEESKRDRKREKEREGEIDSERQN